MKTFTLRSSSPFSSHPKANKIPEPIVVPPGVMVCIPTAAMSRDPEYFPNHDTFDPSRFYPLLSATKSPVLGRSRVSGEARRFKGGDKVGDEDTRYRAENTPRGTGFAGLDVHMPV